MKLKYRSYSFYRDWPKPNGLRPSVMASCALFDRNYVLGAWVQAGLLTDLSIFRRLNCTFLLRFIIGFVKLSVEIELPFPEECDDAQE